MNRHEFATQLRKRVNNPHLINQCGASLCGPAAVMYCWVKNHPDKFVDYITELYEKGQGKLGDMDVKPRQSNRNFNR